MKLTIERAALLKALSHVQSVVERRTTIPILSNVLLRAGDARLHLTATDMDLEIVEAAPADVETGGATTVPAHTLYEIVRKLPDGAQIELTWSGSQEAPLALRAGRSTFRLGCLPVEDFPSMTGGELPTRFSVSADDLEMLLNRTKFAISTQETRYYLNGIYLHAGTHDETAVLRAAATDGHRLARAEMPLPAGAEEMPGIILPRKAVGELGKLLDEAGEDVDVSLSDTKICFSFGSAVMTTKLIDGTFPDYERVIPQQNDKVMEVAAREFALAVDRVSTVSSEKSRAVKLSLFGTTLTLSVTGADQASATDELEIAYEGEPLEIGFNARYLLDVTQQIEGETARFTMADANAPTVVVDAADASALYVLMPMRV